MNGKPLITNILFAGMLLCGLRLAAAASSTLIASSRAPQTISEALRFIGRKYRPATDIKNVVDLRKYAVAMGAKHNQIMASKAPSSRSIAPAPGISSGLTSGFRSPSTPSSSTPSPSTPSPSTPSQSVPSRAAPVSPEWIEALSQLDWLAPGTLENLTPDLFSSDASDSDSNELVDMLTEHFEKPIIYPPTYEKAKQNFDNLILRFGRPGPSYTAGSLVKIEGPGGNITAPSAPAAAQDPVLQNYTFSAVQVRAIEENFLNTIASAPDRLPAHPLGRQWTPRELMCLQYVWTLQAKDLDTMKGIHNLHAGFDIRISEEEHRRRAQADIQRALDLAADSEAQFDTRLAIIKRAFGFGPEVALTKEYSYPPLKNYTEQLQARLRRLQGRMRLQRS